MPRKLLLVFLFWGERFADFVCMCGGCQEGNSFSWGVLTNKVTSKVSILIQNQEGLASLFFSVCAALEERIYNVCGSQNFEEGFQAVQQKLSEAQE